MSGELEIERISGSLNMQSNFCHFFLLLLMAVSLQAPIARFISQLMEI